MAFQLTFSALWKSALSSTNRHLSIQANVGLRHILESKESKHFLAARTALLGEPSHVHLSTDRFVELLKTPVVEQ